MKFTPVLADNPELRDLLERLMAGAENSPLSADDWALRLGDSSFAQQFSDQLHQEWLPMTAPNEFCQRMSNFARDSLKWHPGWPHLWAHTLRVTGWALALAPEAEVDPEVAFLLGILHDIGKLEEFRSGEKHEYVGAEMARETLEDQLPHRTVNQIVNVIAKKQRSSDPAMRLMYDADKLDKIGATGIARRFSTNSSVQMAVFAYERIDTDLTDFPDMHFSTSLILADSKREFTNTFLTWFRVAGADNVV